MPNKQRMQENTPLVHVNIDAQIDIINFASRENPSDCASFLKNKSKYIFLDQYLNEGYKTLL